MVPMPGRRKVNYVSQDASPYADSNVTVVEEDCESEDEAQPNVVFCEDQAPCENLSPKVSTDVLSKQRIRDGILSSGLMRRVLLGSPP